MVLAATDPKGDRNLPPSLQPNPDLYRRVVRRDREGIVVGGAELHTTAASSANEMIVIPCPAITEADEDYAVAFAVPLNTPGFTLVGRPIDAGPEGEHPVSRRSIEVETMTVCDDLHVPCERVCLCGEWQQAGPAADASANFHRYTALSYKPLSIALLIWAAAVAAAQIGMPL